MQGLSRTQNRESKGVEIVVGWDSRQEIDPSTFLCSHPQKIRSLLVTRWLLHLQASCPSSRRKEGKEAKEKKHMPVQSVPFYQENDNFSLDCNLQVIGQNYATSQW